MLSSLIAYVKIPLSVAGMIGKLLSSFKFLIQLLPFHSFIADNLQCYRFYHGSSCLKDYFLIISQIRYMHTSISLGPPGSFVATLITSVVSVQIRKFSNLI